MTVAAWFVRVDLTTAASKLLEMPSARNTKPYLEAWLKRTRRELAGSGRLSELAVILGADGESNVQEWRIKLQRILNGQEEPSLELLTQIDSILARPGHPSVAGDSEADLFD